MNFNGRLDTLYDAALALLYPRACAVCGTASVEARADSPACGACWAATRVFKDAETLCSKCECRRGARRRRRAKGTRRYAAAGARGRIHGGARVRHYEGALRACAELKREPHVASRLARLIHETCLRAPFGAATRVVPVPLHPERERERGFNQAALLGRALSARSGITLDEWSLARVTHTAQHRAGMDARARRESVEEAFRVTSPRLVEGESILLVDDVFTTGATVSACAGALRAAGAREVFVITVARV